MSHFVILAAPRTGSNLLCSLLDSHSEILCHHELFNPDGIFTSLSMRHLPNPFGDLAERDQDPLGLLRRVWHAGDMTGVTSVGFKWTRGQSPTILEHVLNETTIKKIVLRRRNRVKTFLSEKIAQRTQQWEVYEQRDLVESPMIHVDEAELRTHVNMNEAFYRDLDLAVAASQQPVVHVEYESLFTVATQQRLLEFLEVTRVHEAMHAASVKQNPHELGQMIENYAELVRALDGSEFAEELHDSVPVDSP